MTFPLSTGHTGDVQIQHRQRADDNHPSHVLARSLLANSAAAGFISRIQPKSSPSAT